MKRQIWRKILTSFAALMLLLALYCAASFVISEKCLITTCYSLSAPLEKPLRLVQLSDLHNQVFGRKNNRLIKRVRALQPDLILMTGDMINSDDPDLSKIVDLTQAMNEIAPVYYCFGNHELAWIRCFDEDLRSSLEQAGATVLDVEYQDVDCRGNALRLAGYEGYYRAPVMTSRGDKEREEQEFRFFSEFENTDRYRILLNHIPTAWLDWEYRDEYQVDLVFCGHYHGGQAKIPFVGGLFAPNIGYYPEYTKGIFPGKSATVVLSAGLGSEPKLPRFNNPGEIVCVDLLPEK